jgi:hypothetical protein
VRSRVIVSSELTRAQREVAQRLRALRQRWLRPIRSPQRGAWRFAGDQGRTVLTAKRLLTRKLRLELLYGHLNDRHFPLGQLIRFARRRPWA